MHGEVQLVISQWNTVIEQGAGVHRGLPSSSKLTNFHVLLFESHLISRLPAQSRR
jgi:hypothetical protein